MIILCNRICLLLIVMLSMSSLSAFTPISSKSLFYRFGKPIRAVSEIASAESFDKVVNAASDTLVVIDYSTTWCGPCKLVYPKYEELSNKSEYSKVVFLKCIGDATPEANALMKREGIRSVPAFHFWKGKSKIDSVTGGKIDDVEAAIKSHM